MNPAFLCVAGTLALCLATATHAETPAAATSLHERGMATLDKVTGERARTTIESLSELSPDFARWIVEFGYGEVLSRPGLDLRTRELATVAALTALGTAGPQLRAHIHGALNVGCKPQEIVEVVMQMTGYAGFPAAINGMLAVKEVFTERNIALPVTP